MTQTTTLTASRSTPSSAVVNAGFFDLQGFELMQRVAKAFASSSLVPTQYQDNLPNCMIAMDMAQRIGANPLMVMQNLYIVHGTPGWSSKFLIATINVCGRFAALRYEWKGKPGDDDYGCRAWTIEKSTDERLDGIWVTWTMVKAEGWSSKNGSKWKTMPDQMFIYRAAAFWQRAYAPELGMGLTTAEELHDIIDATTNANGVIEVDTEALRASVTPTEKPKRGKKEQAATDTELKKPSEVVDQQTGEVTESGDVSQGGAQKAPSYNYDALLSQIQRCTDVDVLGIVGDELRDLPEGVDRVKLEAAYTEKRAALTEAE